VDKLFAAIFFLQNIFPISSGYTVERIGSVNQLTLVEEAGVPEWCALQIEFLSLRQFKLIFPRQFAPNINVTEGLFENFISLPSKKRKLYQRSLLVAGPDVCAERITIMIHPSLAGPRSVHVDFKYPRFKSNLYFAGGTLPKVSDQRSACDTVLTKFRAIVPIIAKPVLTRITSQVRLGLNDAHFARYPSRLHGRTSACSCRFQSIPRQFFSSKRRHDRPDKRYKRQSSEPSDKRIPPGDFPFFQKQKVIYGVGFAVATLAGFIGIASFLSPRTKRNLAVSIAYYAIGVGGVFFSLIFFVLANS